MTQNYINGIADSGHLGIITAWLVLVTVTLAYLAVLVINHGQHTKTPLWAHVLFVFVIANTVGQLVIASQLQDKRPDRIIAKEYTLAPFDDLLYVHEKNHNQYEVRIKPKDSKPYTKTFNTQYASFNNVKNSSQKPELKVTSTTFKNSHVKHISTHKERLSIEFTLPNGISNFEYDT